MTRPPQRFFGLLSGFSKATVDGPSTGAAMSNSKLVASVDAVVDPIGRAVDRGLAAGHGHESAPPEVLRQAERKHRKLAEVSDEGPAVLAELLTLIERYPHVERLQLLAGRVLEGTVTAQVASAAWAGIYGRLPQSAEALRMHLRWLSRLTGSAAAAQAVLAARFPTFPTAFDEVMLYARAYDEVKMFTEADVAFETAIRLEPTSEAAHLAFVRALQARGDVARAATAHARAEALGVSSEQLSRLKVANELEQHMLGANGRRTDGSQRVSDTVLIELLDKILERRKSIDLGNHSYVGPVFMLSGSLGPGGAERQLVNTAIGLQSCIDNGHKLDGRDVIGPVTVCVRSLTNRKDAAFFAPQLQKARVQILEYSSFEPYGGNRRHSVIGEIADLLRFLPHQMIEGTERLTDMIAGQRPDVVHIWQDGAIFATALAALLADVPRIVLNVRTAPPIDRPARMKPEYGVLYPRLMKMPGVVLTANSRYAARRYADWLSVDPLSIPVVYNGLKPLPTDADAKTRDTLRAFNEKTAGHDFTVGTVMRFDDNKRPYAWLASAAELLSRCPTARFIMVGDGPLQTAAREYAAMLKITERVLFVGHSSQVGFWLTQFDGFLLLSVFEGLPNVLIESQFAGVPVLSTPAGGAAETIIPGQTGLVLDMGKDVDPVLVADKLMLLRSNADLKSEVAAIANQWVRRQFSVEQMLEATVRAYLR